MKFLTRLQLTAGFQAECLVLYWLRPGDAEACYKPDGLYSWRSIGDFSDMVYEKLKGARKMARKQAQSRSTDWINVNLTADDKELIENAETTDDQLFGGLLALALGDYEVRLKHQPDKGQYVAFLFPVGDDHPHRGAALSAFAQDPRTALLVLEYKHFEVLGEVWPVGLENSSGTFG